jgi:hypothetical protein|tara:strand:- start:42 stop:227 length:186 start_codon:yes stop_codon:yes gene_type:complete
MKIYHLTIAYNDKTEEIEYIQEELEEEPRPGFIEFEMEFKERYFDDEELLELIDKHGLGEA